MSNTQLVASVGWSLRSHCAIANMAGRHQRLRNAMPLLCVRKRTDQGQQSPQALPPSQETKKLKNKAALVTAQGGDAIFAAADVGQPKDAQALVERAVALGPDVRLVDSQQRIGLEIHAPTRQGHTTSAAGA